jgi:E3 ubiquitin-protein ligase ZSWIM2
MSQASQRLAPWRPKPGARATDILARARERDARLDPNDHDIEPDFMLMKRKGPTSFVVHERGRHLPFTLSLGAAQTCSCGGGLNPKPLTKHPVESRLVAEARRLAGAATHGDASDRFRSPNSTNSEEVCAHILFVMTKVLRVPRSNPIVWQVSLVDRELDEALRCERGGGGRQRNTLRDANREETRRRDDMSSSKNASKSVSARPLEPDEPCPICYDPMEEPRRTDNTHGVRRLVHCGEGCGRSVHGRCLKAFQTHLKSSEAELTCPMCRCHWGDFQWPPPRHMERTAYGRTPSGGTSAACGGCQASPIQPGDGFECVACDSFHLCRRCFDGGVCHATHPFVRLGSRPGSELGEPVTRPEPVTRRGVDVGGGREQMRPRRRRAPSGISAMNVRGDGASNGGNRSSAGGGDTSPMGLSLQGVSLGLSAR